MASDGDDAWAKLEEFAPDVVLADVFMPGTNGYGLCERIKQNERFGRIPVILLIGSFEPFDEAEARRVGADDVVTKPFQSIRQLVSRVGSLVGGNAPAAAEPQQFSTLGLETTQSNFVPESAEPPHVTVLVEAPTIDSPEVPEKTCQPDIEMQTADTQQLPPVNREEQPFSPASETVSEVLPDDRPFAGQDESVAAELPAPEEPLLMDTQEMNLPMTQQTIPTSVDATDAFLDLEDFQTGAPVSADEFILELEGGPTLEPEIPVSVIPEKPSPAPIEAESFEPPTAVAQPAVDAREQRTSESAGVSNLSAEAIDAIARRVVEQLSDRVVREIAWEVVPELAELLVKQRLDEQK